MAELNGDIARQMAAAGVKGSEKPKASSGLTSLFRVVGFKLPNKAEAFKNDDGTTTQRIAHAIVKLGGTQMHFTASIYKATDKAGEVTVYCGMPSSGKSFPRPVFLTDDPETQSAYDAWRVGVVTEHFVPWFKGLAKTDTPAQAQGIRVKVDLS